MKTLMLLGSVAVLAGVSTAVSASPWISKEITDKFTDKPYVIATNEGAVVYGSDSFKVSFECRGKSNFFFTIDTFHELGDKSEQFKFQYRTDSDKPNKIWMRTFTNSDTGGMNSINAVDVVNDFLNADHVVVRAVSLDRDQYDAEISLAGAKEPILKAVKACGLTIE